MNFEQQMYEVSEKWEASYFSAEDQQRVTYIANLIPSDARSLLDVGCGNGILVNYLAKTFPQRFDRICATDRSASSLSFVETEKQQASIEQLPFKDGEFEVVCCLEVIEHLPMAVYYQALEELNRVASKYVIISVPYREDLAYNRVTCIKCSTAFSPFYHMHSFDEAKMERLFSSQPLHFRSFHLVSETSIPYAKSIKKWLSRLMHPKAFPNNCICPMCGYNEWDKLKEASRTRTASAPISRKGWSRYWPHYRQPKWMAAVYEK